MSSRELNVLFLPKWYPSKFEPFDGNFIENHAIAVSKKCNLGLIFVHSDEELTTNFEVNKIVKHGFPEYHVYYKRPNSGLGIINQASAFFRYRKAQLLGYKAYLKEIGKPDICHVHINGKSALLANFLKVSANIPFLITEHWSGYTKENGAFKGYFRKKFHQYTAKQSSGITCVSNYLKEAIESHGISSKFSIVPNVVDTDLFQIEREKSSNPIRIVHIANICKTPKNIHLIVEALNNVVATRTDFEIDIIGTGPDKAYMLEKLQSGSMKNRFTFHGEIELKAVAKILSKANFLLLYSQFETQSVVMIEAFASGVPVLTSGVGGIPEYINKERGIVIEPNLASALEKGLNSMLNEHSKFNSDKLRAYALKNFSVEQIQNQFMSLYRQILSND